MLMFRPQSDPSLYAVGGKYEPIAANFPALASFFKFDETSGNTISDSMSNLSHTDVANIVYIPEFNGMSCNLPAGTAPTVGGAPLPGTKDILIVGCGVAATAASQTVLGFGFGTGSSTFARALWANNTGATSMCSQCDGTAAAVSTAALSALTQDVKVGGALAIDRGAVLQSRRFPNSTGAAVAQTSGGVASSGSVPDATESKAIRFGGVMLGFAAFYFTSGLPANWEAGSAWMVQQWMNGNKWIYPGFKGLV